MIAHKTQTTFSCIEWQIDKLCIYGVKSKNKTFRWNANYFLLPYLQLDCDTFISFALLTRIHKDLPGPLRWKQEEYLFSFFLSFFPSFFFNFLSFFLSWVFSVHTSSLSITTTWSHNICRRISLTAFHTFSKKKRGKLEIENKT